MNFIIAAIIHKTTAIIIAEIINESERARKRKESGKTNRRGYNTFCLSALASTPLSVMEYVFRVFIIVITIIFYWRYVFVCIHRLAHSSSHTHIPTHPHTHTYFESRSQRVFVICMCAVKESLAKHWCASTS